MKQKARDNIKLDDKELEKELAKKMINPYLFIRNFENRFQN